MKWIIRLPAILLAGIPVTLFGGLVLADLWRWFIVPVFGGPQPTYLQAVGMTFVASFFLLNLARKELANDEDKPLVNAFAKLFGACAGYAILWGFGAVWSAFI